MKKHCVLLALLLAGVQALALPATSYPHPRFSTSEVESQIVELTNRERLSLSLQPLLTVPRLADCAREHSWEMLELDYFDHNSPVEALREPWHRVRAAGLQHDSVGENIFACEGYTMAEIAPLAVSSWMSSPDHRANIVRRDFACIGVGVCVRGQEVMITQDFSGPQGSSASEGQESR